MKTKILIPLLFSLLLLVACKKDDPLKRPKLPDATQDGRNTMGFTFNDGKVWVPYYDCTLFNSGCRKTEVIVRPLPSANSGFRLKFSRYAKDNRSTLNISPNLKGAFRATGEKIDSLKVNFTSDTVSPWIEYNQIQLGSSFIITRFDLENEIISGTFHFILKDNQSGKTITLNNGRFDYKFGTCECD